MTFLSDVVSAHSAAVTITRTLGAGWKIKMVSPHHSQRAQANTMGIVLEAFGVNMLSASEYNLRALAARSDVGHIELIINGHRAERMGRAEYIEAAQKAADAQYLCAGLTMFDSSLAQLHLGCGLNVIGSSVQDVIDLTVEHFAGLSAKPAPTHDIDLTDWPDDGPSTKAAPVDDASAEYIKQLECALQLLYERATRYDRVSELEDADRIQAWNDPVDTHPLIAKRRGES